jgi:hypothetical protein
MLSAPSYLGGVACSALEEEGMGDEFLSSAAARAQGTQMQMKMVKIRGSSGAWSTHLTNMPNLLSRDG